MAAAHVMDCCCAEQRVSAVASLVHPSQHSTPVQHGPGAGHGSCCNTWTAVLRAGSRATQPLHLQQPPPLAPCCVVSSMAPMMARYSLRMGPGRWRTMSLATMPGCTAREVMPLSGDSRRRISLLNIICSAAEGGGEVRGAAVMGSRAACSCVPSLQATLAAADAAGCQADSTRPHSCEQPPHLRQLALRVGGLRVVLPLELRVAWLYAGHHEMHAGGNVHHAGAGVPPAGGAQLEAWHQHQGQQEVAQVVGAHVQLDAVTSLLTGRCREKGRAVSDGCGMAAARVASIPGASR